MPEKRTKLPPAYVEGAESVEPFNNKTFHKGEWKDRPWNAYPIGHSHAAEGFFNGSWDNAVNTLEGE